MRRRAFAIDDARGHVLETRFAQESAQLDFGEPEPDIGIQLAGLFEGMPGQVENGDAAAGTNA